MSASTTKVSFTTPVGRIVQGSLYKEFTTDAEGKPLTFKTGPKAGQTGRVQFFFSLAIKKNAGEQHFAQTEWGAKIWQVGHACFPALAQRPDFAWKVEDGDSTVPNKKGKRPCDNEGWAGHWILKLSAGFAPKVYRQENGGLTQILEDGYVKPGYFVQVSVSVDGNGSQQQAGVFLNHNLVLFVAFGEEIQFGMSAEEAFGSLPAAALPPGASLTPMAASIPLPGTVPAGPGLVPPPSYAPVVPGMPVPAMATAPPAVPSIPVQPNLGFLQVPPAAAVTPSVPVLPTPPITAPAAPAYRMTGKAPGFTYEQFKAQGWDDANLIAQGYMTF